MRVLPGSFQAPYSTGDGGRSLREEALNSGQGWEARPAHGCPVYGRRVGMCRHVAEAHPDL